MPALLCSANMSPHLLMAAQGFAEKAAGLGITCLINNAGRAALRLPPLYAMLHALCKGRHTRVGPAAPCLTLLPCHPHMQACLSGARTTPSKATRTSGTA